MTGQALLNQKLKEQGFTQKQIDSKVVGAVLDIIANDNIFLDVNSARQELEILRGYAEKQKNRINREEKEFLHRRQKYMEEYCEKEKYITNFLQKLSECETPEGRDRMRMLQMYINSIDDISSASANAAYIAGLASIIAGSDIKGLEKLEKIESEPFRL